MIEIETGQPTPEEIVKDAFNNIPQNELAEAVPAQAPLDEAISRIAAAAEEALDEIADDIPDKYTLSELEMGTRILSDSIPHILRLSPQEQIQISYELSPGYFIRHSSLPQDNHAWRIATPDRETLELRTGIFHDSAVGSDYIPKLKVNLLGTLSQPKQDGREAFVLASAIIGKLLQHPKQ